jgi:DNA-directed RNA polymerase
MARGLLQFSEGKRLGASGLYWLKVHFANKMGRDKLSFPERLQYTESNISLIHNIAKNPMKYREWAESEDAWQSLAAAFDLSAALLSESPDDYISH